MVEQEHGEEKMTMTATTTAPPTLQGRVGTGAGMITKTTMG